MRTTAPDGERKHSEKFLIRRGVLQGDIFSPLCFIIALQLILLKHGDCKEGSGDGLFGLWIKSLEYADDAALSDLTVEAATKWINRITEGALKDADMEVSVPKMECMHVDSELVQHFSRVTASAADYQETGKNGLIGKCSHP